MEHIWCALSRPKKSPGQKIEVTVDAYFISLINPHPVGSRMGSKLHLWRRQLSILSILGLGLLILDYLILLNQKNRLFNQNILPESFSKSLLKIQASNPRSIIRASTERMETVNTGADTLLIVMLFWNEIPQDVPGNTLESICDQSLYHQTNPFCIGSCKI